MNFYIIILLILLVLSGFFSGAEVALVSTGPFKLKTFLKEKKRGALALARLKANPRRMIITILIGNNVVNISAAAIVTILTEQRFGSHALGIATGLLTLVVLIFGEIFPKTFSSAHSSGVALLVAPLILALEYALYPIVWALDWLTSRTQRILRLQESDIWTRADLRSMLEFGEEKKLLKPEERFLMERALRFSNIRAREVMTPFEQVFALDENRSLQDAVVEIVQSGFSRIPVFRQSGRNVVGIIFIKDVMRNMQQNEMGKLLCDLASPPIFVSADIGIDELFKVFHSHQTHVALVHGDRKEVIGLVTLEDLLEELVGEITDESDVTPQTIIRIDRNTVVAHGETAVERVNRFFLTDLPARPGQKLDELILEFAQKPKQGETVHIKNLGLTLEEMKGGRILKVRIVKKAVS